MFWAVWAATGDDDGLSGRLFSSLHREHVRGRKRSETLWYVLALPHGPGWRFVATEIVAQKQDTGRVEPK